MKNKLLLVLAATALSVSTATAGDWDGGYIGLNYSFADDTGSPVNLAGVLAGYNWDMGTQVIGGEVELDWFPGSGVSYTSLNLRGGFEVSDSTMIFGVLGYGARNNGTTKVTRFGIGAEAMVTDTISVRGDLMRWDEIGGTDYLNELKLGVAFHF